MTRFAGLISLIFHPVFMPLLGFLLIINSSAYIASAIPPRVKWVSAITIFMFTCILPVLNVLFLKKKGLVNSIYLETMRERKLPYMLTVICYLLLYYFLKGLHLPPVLNLFALGATVTAIALLFINLQWKISAHMAATGALLGAVIGVAERFRTDLNLTLTFLLIVAGLTGFSRLQLKAHNPAQVYCGFLLGVGIMLLFVLGA